MTSARLPPLVCVLMEVRDRDLPRSPTWYAEPGLSTCQVHAPYRVPASLINNVLWCRSIGPACHRLRLQRPRLRTRLTLGRLTVPRNPQAFGVSGSHRHVRYSFRHSHFSSLHQSSRSGFSDMQERSPTTLLAITRLTEHDHEHDSQRRWDA